MESPPRGAHACPAPLVLYCHTSHCAMKLIPLTQGKFAMVDDADYDWLNHYKWYAHRRRKAFYAGRHVQGREVSMHQIVAAVMGIFRADHADRNGLNNQRHNLRPATGSQQGANRGLGMNNTSGFRGVSWWTTGKRWHAQICKDKKIRHLGYFNTAEEAARAYDSAASELHGEFAVLNF